MRCPLSIDLFGVCFGFEGGVDLEVVAEPAHSEVEGQGVEQGHGGFEYVARSDEYPELWPEWLAGVDWEAASVEVRDRDDREGIHELTHECRAVVSQPEMPPLGQAFPEVT